jgi:hypothetical protein
MRRVAGSSTFSDGPRQIGTSLARTVGRDAHCQSAPEPELHTCIKLLVLLHCTATEKFEQGIAYPEN